MEKEILEEIMKECKWYEKIVVILFKNIFIDTYKKGVKTGFNWQ